MVAAWRGRLPRCWPARRAGVRVQAEVGEQDLHQGSVRDQAGRGGGFLDGLPQPGLVDGADQHLMVLQVRYQFGVGGAAGVEVGPHPDHYQGRRLPRIHLPADRAAVSGDVGCGHASRRAQRLDERAAFLLVGALGEDLFELVDDQHQPRPGGGLAAQPSASRHPARQPAGRRPGSVTTGRLPGSGLARWPGAGHW